MANISVPVTAEQSKIIEKLIKKGLGRNKADVLRKALDFLAEEEAVRTALMAEQEPSLKGDLKKLAKKI